MKLGNPIEGQQYSRGQLGLGTLVISLFLFGSIICKMMHYSLFLKVLPHGPDVACWLISRLGDCLSSLHLPSFAWKLWPSASKALERVDICFLYQSFVLWAPTLCGVDSW